MRSTDIGTEPCSIARSVALLGDRWTLIVLRQAFLGLRRFEDFRSSLGVSRTLLSQRLGVLVEAGILERRAYRDARRTREEYRLTEKGLDLYPVLMALRTWGDRYMAPDGPPVVYRHRHCDGAAEIRHVCDHCGQELTARDIIPLPGPGAASGQQAEAV
ncbi:helix-turn-helix domain-containing protein [Streptomyces sp. HNM0645]|uniref:winged helix-turn-helix transcriptional regulator n=1 Tax=Streptomyces sp. HNM0645 TaxID=2782343 RepID=UPI0024B86779|nr:helix-turn-helix domain-containing protein [Streptomyces sp. HNM0645]MDI9883940.1 helix-turn-helix domain-containing protein [Streptomyces sp. HNM0645]